GQKHLLDRRACGQLVVGSGHDAIGRRLFHELHQRLDMGGIDDALGHLTILPSTWWPPRRERPLTTRAEGPDTEHTRTNAPERKAPGAGTGRQGLARVVFRDGEAKPALRSHGGRFDTEPRSKTRHGTDDHGGGPEITPRHAGDLRAHRYPRARPVQRLAPPRS